MFRDTPVDQLAENFLVMSIIENPWGLNAIASQFGEEGHCLPMMGWTPPDSIDRARVVLLAAGLCLHHQNLPASIQSFHSVTHVSFSPGAPCFIIGEGARAIDSSAIAYRSSLVTGGLILASSFLTIIPKCFTILSALWHL
jgi:hypothetical protein